MAVGQRAPSAAAAVRAGVSRVAEHPYFSDAIGEPVMMGLEPSLDPLMSVVDRICTMAEGVLREVAESLTSTRPIPTEVPVLIVLPEERPGLPAASLKQIEVRLSGMTIEGLPKARIRFAGRGHVGAATACKEALQHLSAHGQSLCIVAGVDSYADGFTLDWLEESRRLASEPVRAGFPPGEGAAAFVLASASTRRAAGFDSLATVRAVATALDPEAADPEAEPLGKGLTAVVREVAQQLERPAEHFEDLFIDINGERPRTTDLGFVSLRCGTLFRDVTEYTRAVPSTGELGAASMPFNIVLATQAWARGWARGGNALVLGSSRGMERAAILLGKGDSSR